MKLAVLYICTGRYKKFFAGFYDSARKYLLVEAEKTFFVWTDDDSLGEGKPDVRILHKECAGFPSDSLFRYEMFLEIEDELRDYDYIYFFNANAEFRQMTDSEIFPDESGLAVGVWYGRRERQHPMFYPYERNKKSRAYVKPYGKDYVYFMGGLNGGKADNYLQMIKALSQNIRNDYDEGIVAKVHDESHINAYLRSHPCKKIGRECCWPEEWEAKDFTPKMVFRDKVLQDSYFDKGRKHSLLAKAKKAAGMAWSAVRWYLYI